jgi:hypothetical protein
MLARQMPSVQQKPVWWIATTIVFNANAAELAHDRY